MREPGGRDLLDFVRALIRLRAEPPGVPPPPLLPRPGGGPRRRGGQDQLSDIAWFTPAGEEMTDDDWAAGFAKSLTVFLNGDAITEPDPRGERIRDDSFLLLFNASELDLEFTVPPQRYGEQWVKVLDTALPLSAVPDAARGQAGRRRPESRPLDAGPRACLQPPWWRRRTPGRPTGCSSSRVSASRPPRPSLTTWPTWASSHVYLSPILQATPGSRHGYDVVDHSRVSADLGGEGAFRDMVRRFRMAGLGVVVDIVPNHMAIPVPESLNRPLWAVLRDGPGSPFASWFDVDWAAQDGRLLLPVLGGPVAACLADLTAGRPQDGEPVLRYFDHVFPVRPGTAGLPLPGLLAVQHYRLADWRLAATELNWRRFFDISSLIAVRVEDPDVFEATHAVILGLAAEGLIDGLRVDHPDGLADPRGYLRRLAGRAGGLWVCTEKILCGDERLPADWPCAAPPATTVSAPSAACSSTRPGPGRWPPGTCGSPAAGRPSPRWPRRPNGRKRSTRWPPRWPGWPG